MFDDDTVIYVSDINFESCINKVNNIIYRLRDCCDDKLTFKCHCKDVTNKL